MIKALVLDVDGVLVGEKVGYNSPNPHPVVIERLKKIEASGIPIILCTGKPHYSIAAIIEGAQLKNPHITNGGSVVIDPIDNNIVASYPIAPYLTQKILDACLSHNLYTELYSEQDYFLTKTQANVLTKTHAHVLQKDPVLVDSLMDIAARNRIVKVMPISDDESGIPGVEEILAPFAAEISTAWGLHPIANPHQFCGITAKGISKRQTTLDVLSRLSVGQEDVLGVGDSASDWTYMELCGYTAAMENAQPGLLSLVGSRGEFGFIGGHVDVNGILSIFDHFHLPDSDTHP